LLRIGQAHLHSGYLPPPRFRDAIVSQTNAQLRLQK